MTQLLKWIYELGYKNGYRDCREQIEEQARQDYLLEKYVKESNL